MAGSEVGNRKGGIGKEVVMPASKGKSKGGRPKKVLDENQIRALAKINCTHAEIAAVMGCHKDTIADRFSDLIKEARNEGKSSLRRWQWAAAEKGDRTMLIWLGKQHLGQTEPKLVLAGDEDAPIRETVTFIMPDNGRRTADRIGSFEELKAGGNGGRAGARRA